MNSSGSLLSENRYMPFGEVRTISGTTNVSETDFGYTGQRDYGGDFGLMDYRARFYSPRLGRFTQGDSIVPNISPQSFNRYSYVNNNTVNYSDPSGHSCYDPVEDAVIPGPFDCDGNPVGNDYENQGIIYFLAVGGDPLVIFTVDPTSDEKWSDSEKTAISAAAWAIAQKLGKALGMDPYGLGG